MISGIKVHIPAFPPLNSRTQRTTGVEFLSLVISRCPPERINRQSSTSSYELKGYEPDKLASAKVLVKFMSDKLDDTDTIIPALKGLASLVTLPAFTSVEAVDVMKAYDILVI